MIAASKHPVAIVTGGTMGIGLAIVQRFVKDGYRVAVVGRNQERLNEVAAQIGASVLPLQGDVAVRTDVERIAAAVSESFGTVDALINNAGVLENTYIGSPLAEAEAVYDRVVGASLKGSFLMSHAIAPMLKSPGGRIINLGSIVAHSGASVAGYTAYTPAKAGVHGLTLALARELGPRGINVYTVAPGMTAQTGQTSDWDDARINRIQAQIPLGRLGKVEDIANAVAWLASPEASYITGMTLPVNGGWLFYP